MSRDYKPEVQMIQVTYDEYNQCYMKHDTWALSSWGGG